MQISFAVKGSGERMAVETERPELIFGCTFLVTPGSGEVRFTGDYALNPVTAEEIPIFADGSQSSTAMGIPGHDQRSFELASRLGLPVRTVVEPITGKVQENPEFRRSVVALVRNPSDGSVLSINWGPDAGGNLLIGGGLKEGEDPVECARREVEEETGYSDLKFVGKSERIHHHYFAHSKNVAREIEATGVFFELGSDSRKDQNLEEDEVGKFKVEWLSEDDAESRISDELHSYVFTKFIRNRVYEGEGIMVDVGEYDGLLSTVAREKIVQEIQSLS